MTRVCIAGGPKTGKTTLSQNLHESSLVLDPRFLATQSRWTVPVRHTDDTLTAGLSWSEGSALVATWLNEPGPWIIEGVAVPRALRKWLTRHDGEPCDVVYWLGIIGHVQLTPGQASMGRGCETVWREVLPELEARGVEIRTVP